jgi:hypothetical protein
VCVAVVSSTPRPLALPVPWRYSGRTSSRQEAEMVRESVFVCSARSGDIVRTAHVLAWDEREAAELFATELEEEDVSGATDIRVEAVRGERAGSLAEG